MSGPVRPVRPDGAGRGSAATPAPDPALELSAASVSVGGRVLLHDVNLTVARGEFVAVLGPNGAGKSTLMRMILGLIPVRGGGGQVRGGGGAQVRGGGGAQVRGGGDVRVLGGTSRETRRRVGYLPQRQGFDRGTRIRGVDLVGLGLDGARWGLPLALTGPARVRRDDHRARVAAVIDRVGATAYARRPIGELSGGEQQRLLIAAALVREPELLILDEPLDSLDLPNQAAVAGLVGDVARTENVAVLLVAHDVNPLLPYLDRVVYLAQGRALCGPVSEVISGPRLSALYGAPIEVLRTTDGRLVVVGGPDGPHHHGHGHGHGHP